MAAMVTETNANKVQTGLRLLARMIARAYLKQGLDEQGSRREVAAESVDCSKEAENGDKRGV